jgi:hypothetical protein
MTDWVTTTATAATAAGTLILAVATFSSVRSAQRSARATERSLLAGIRPVIVSSRLEDPMVKVGFMDDRWLRVPGGQAVAEVTDDAIYLAVSLRNVGNGLAVLDRWELTPERVTGYVSRPDPSNFRRLTRDLYVPAGDMGFWQGALRDPTEPLFAQVRDAITERHTMTVDLLYGDHEGGQRTITRIGLIPGTEDRWMASVSRHWYLDRPDPR